MWSPYFFGASLAATALRLWSWRCTLVGICASKAALCATGRARTAADNQCRSRHAPSEHARPVLGQRTTVVIEQIPCLCADISVRNVRPHNARTRLVRKDEFDAL